MLTNMNIIFKTQLSDCFQILKTHFFRVFLYTLLNEAVNNLANKYTRKMFSDILDFFENFVI